MSGASDRGRLRAVSDHTRCRTDRCEASDRGRLRAVSDGVIAMAPGGNVCNQTFREKLGESVAQARKFVADGKGDERTRLLDYEGARGSYLVVATPANYLGWFDPDGAMNQTSAMRT